VALAVAGKEFQIAMREIQGVRVWGEPDEHTLTQALNCARHPAAVAVCLMADAHVGYGVPVGGVVAYRDAVSPSAVGFDIACGIKAVRTDLRAEDVRPHLDRLLADIARRVPFGLGRERARPVDHPVLEDPTWREVRELAALRARARAQLGTVGGGNHFVDLLEAEDGSLWVAAHFGSRGLGHGICSGFLHLARGEPFDPNPPREDPDAPPVVISTRTELGQAYLAAMRLAGAYAYAGRDLVVDDVLALLGARAVEVVHNHHNYAWEEEHGGERLLVVRKGATPAWPGQTGFVGGSMGDIAAVVAGVDSREAALALHSTVHGAGRILSRTAARGRRRGRRREGGLVTREAMEEATRRFGVRVVGGDVDEAPQVYRPLEPVLRAHAGTLRVRHRLRPIGVVMAGPDVRDPYKD
jgi:tRNA-splicing ligase RtcB